MGDDLLDAAERPRVQGWSLRSALVRYAQPQPVRASQVLELVRRIEWALKPHLKLLERDGLGAAPDQNVAGVLEALADLDALGDDLATWATDPPRNERPDARVDATLAAVTAKLEALGVPKEDGPRPRPR
jgi:hypothetical protein